MNLLNLLSLWLWHAFVMHFKFLMYLNNGLTDRGFIICPNMDVVLCVRYGWKVRIVN